MKSIEPKNCSSRKAECRAIYERLLAQLRHDQLEAAIAGRLAESAFYAAEARALQDEYAHENALCA